MVSAVVSVTVATEAQAGTTQLWDSVEGATPWTRWQGGGSGDGVAGYDLNGGVARTGANNGWLHVGNGWAANRLPVSLSGFHTRNNCAAGVYANVLAPGAQVGLQIWNPNGWTIIAEIYPWVVGNGTGYHVVSMGNLNLSGFSGTIYLQFIYGNSDGIKKFIRFDDMVLECYW